MHQENKGVSRKFVHNNFTISGGGRAHAIVIAASHVFNCETTVKHKALQAIILTQYYYHHYSISSFSFVEILRRANYHTDTTNPVHVLLAYLFFTNPWVYTYNLANAQLDQLDIWLAHPPMTPHFNIGMSHGKEQEGTYGSSHNEAMVL